CGGCICRCAAGYELQYDLFSVRSEFFLISGGSFGDPVQLSLRRWVRVTVSGVRFYGLHFHNAREDITCSQTTALESPGILGPGHFHLSLAIFASRMEARHDIIQVHRFWPFLTSTSPPTRAADPLQCSDLTPV
ncbi:hypothetical protein BaRGS_00013132, partial [Batillaria attramentaria]